jgi:hypothetical protein
MSELSLHFTMQLPCQTFFAISTKFFVEINNYIPICVDFFLMCDTLLSNHMQYMQFLCRKHPGKEAFYHAIIPCAESTSGSGAGLGSRLGEKSPATVHALPGAGQFSQKHMPG